MFKRSLKWIFVFLAVCVLCAAVHIIHTNHESGKTAVIKQGGKTIKTIDLSAVSAPYEITVEGDNGYNIILIEKDRISVKDADCPDKLCVKQGAIDSGAYPIVCLPHKLSVSIEKADGEVDAIVGGN